MPHVLLFWDRCLCPHWAANMRPAPLLAWPRAADTLPPILALASLTNPQPCCLINHCTVETVDVMLGQFSGKCVGSAALPPLFTAMAEVAVAEAQAWWWRA